MPLIQGCTTSHTTNKTFIVELDQPANVSISMDGNRPLIKVTKGKCAESGYLDDGYETTLCNTTISSAYKPKTPRLIAL